MRRPLLALLAALCSLPLGAQTQRLMVRPGDTLIVTGAPPPVPPPVTPPPVVPPPVATGTHEPPGMATQINTGELRAFPARLAVFSPATMSASGEAAGNLTIAPDAGLRLTYAPSLSGGYSPARAGMAIAQPGTGWYYQRQKVRFSANWTLNGNVGVKLSEPRTTSTAENDVVGTMSDNRTTDMYLVILQQGPVTRNLPAPSPPTWTYAAADPNGRITVGVWHTLEVLFQPESTSGAGDGAVWEWVDGALADHETNIHWLAAGQAPGWPYYLIDPTYGGGTHRPPAVMTIDVDSIYVSTK